MVRIRQTTNGMTYSDNIIPEQNAYPEPTLDSNLRDILLITGIALGGTAILAFLASPLFTRILSYFMGA